MIDVKYTALRSLEIMAFSSLHVKPGQGDNTRVLSPHFNSNIVARVMHRVAGYPFVCSYCQSSLGAQCYMLFLQFRTGCQGCVDLESNQHLTHCPTLLALLS